MVSDQCLCEWGGSRMGQRKQLGTTAVSVEASGDYTVSPKTRWLSRTVQCWGEGSAGGALYLITVQSLGVKCLLHRTKMLFQLTQVMLTDVSCQTSFSSWESKSFSPRGATRMFGKVPQWCQWRILGGSCSLVWWGQFHNTQKVPGVRHPMDKDLKE